MGQRGPAPKPTALRLLEGNRSKRPINPAEPKATVKKPHCPGYLDDVAKKEWRRIVPILLRMRVLTEADYIALANMCQAYSTMIAAQTQLNKTGLLFKMRSGYVQPSPLLSIVNTSMRTVTAICKEFGLTPSARSRVQAIAAGEDEAKSANPWEAIRRMSNAG